MKLHALVATNLNIVTGYGPGYIEINGVRHSGNLIVGASVVERWNVGTFESLRAEDFSPVVALSPEVVLLGTGDGHRLPSSRLAGSLARAGIGLEAMDTNAACRTYNILVSDGRRVAGAFLQESPKP